MAYPPHALLSIGGQMMTETWSVNIRMWGEEYATSSPDERFTTCEDMIEGVITPVQQFFSGNAGLNSQAKCYWIKLNPIGTNGKYEQNRTIRVDSTPQPFATGGGSACPPQTAFVTSLRTGVERGLASKGRLYWPNGITTVDDMGNISIAQANAMAAYIGSFLVALGASTTGGVNAGSHLRPCVVSPGKGGASSADFGVARPITSVKVGRVIDTQRRRRRELLENYVTRTMASFA
jgi:hypothetical protein